MAFCRFAVPVIVMLPTLTVFKLSPEFHEKPLNETPLTATLVPVAVGPKFAEANSVPTVSTSEIPEIVVGEPQLMVAAFAGWMAIDKQTAVIAAETEKVNVLCKLMKKNFSVR